MYDRHMADKTATKYTSAQTRYDSANSERCVGHARDLRLEPQAKYEILYEFKAVSITSATRRNAKE